MLIGIDASRAFLKRRTGIEEYSYQVIAALRKPLADADVVLYIRSDQSVSFDIPDRWRVKRLRSPRLWTQGRLSLEMFLHPPDTLFVPAHTVPIIHPARTIVTVHGLEYETFPAGYSFWDRLYMRLSIRFSVRAAIRVIAVSENTKRDLMRFYDVPEEKISVIYEGVPENFQFPISNLQTISKSQFSNPETPYLLFIGRLEERKNIVRIIEAFGVLKEKYDIPHELVLAGKPGYGYEQIRSAIRHSPSVVRETGYVSEEEKRRLLKGADAFLFPTLYEGFGLPVLEAQAAGVPVVASTAGSLQEIGGKGALYADPLSVADIAETTRKLLSEKGLRDDILEEGYENVRRFGWEKCAVAVAGLLRS